MPAPVGKLLFIELLGPARLPFAAYGPDHRARVELADIQRSNGRYRLTQPKSLGSIVRVTELVGSRSGARHQSLARTERAPQLHHRPLSPAAAAAARIPLHRYRGLNNSRGEARRSRLPPLGRSLCHRFVRRRGASPGRGAAVSKALIASPGPPSAEGLGNAKHDELGEGYALDEQEGAVSAEDAERAFGLACPVRGQDTRGRLNQPKIFVGSSGQETGAVDIWVPVAVRASTAIFR